MPIYEYRCGACGHHLEALQKMSESPLRKCPECGKSQLKRLVSASQFRLKGTGWYDKERKRNLVDSGNEPSEASAEKSGDGAAKEDSGKAAAKSNGHATKRVSTKPSTVKPVRPKRGGARPAARAKRPAAKSRAKAARV
jgi:putative FmdB family regulatory protein